MEGDTKREREQPMKTSKQECVCERAKKEKTLSQSRAGDRKSKMNLVPDVDDVVFMFGGRLITDLDSYYRFCMEQDDDDDDEEDVRRRDQDDDPPPPPPPRVPDISDQQEIRILREIAKKKKDCSFLRDELQKLTEELESLEVRLEMVQYGY